MGYCNRYVCVAALLHTQVVMLALVVLAAKPQERADRQLTALICLANGADLLSQRAPDLPSQRAPDLLSQRAPDRQPTV